MMYLKRAAMITLAMVTASCSSGGDDEEPSTSRINAEIHNLGIRTVTVTVTPMSPGDEPQTLTEGQLLADDYPGGVGTGLVVSATAPAVAGAFPAATGSRTCTAKGPIVDTSVYGIINVVAGSGTTITITCVNGAHWDQGT